MGSKLRSDPGSFFDVDRKVFVSLIDADRLFLRTPDYVFDVKTRQAGSAARLANLSTQTLDYEAFNLQTPLYTEKISEAQTFQTAVWAKLQEPTSQKNMYEIIKKLNRDKKVELGGVVQPLVTGMGKKPIKIGTQGRPLLERLRDLKPGRILDVSGMTTDLKGVKNVVLPKVGKTKYMSPDILIESDNLAKYIEAIEMIPNGRTVFADAIAEVTEMFRTKGQGLQETLDAIRTGSRLPIDLADEGLQTVLADGEGEEPSFLEKRITLNPALQPKYVPRVETEEVKAPEIAKGNYVRTKERKKELTELRKKRSEQKNPAPNTPSGFARDKDLNLVANTGYGIDPDVLRQVNTPTLSPKADRKIRFTSPLPSRPPERIPSGHRSLDRSPTRSLDRSPTRSLDRASILAKDRSPILARDKSPVKQSPTSRDVLDLFDFDSSGKIKF